MTDLKTEDFPDAILPLYRAFIEEIFSPHGKRDPFHELKVSVTAPQMQAALMEIKRMQMAMDNASPPLKIKGDRTITKDDAAPRSDDPLKGYGGHYGYDERD